MTGTSLECPNHVAFADALTEDLRNAGYTRAVPLPRAWEDRKRVEASFCVCCGAARITYDGQCLIRNGEAVPGSYRYFAVCVACWHIEEQAT